MNASKTEIDFWCFAGYYQYRIFKVVDGHKQVYYIGEPAKPSATRIADSLEQLKTKLNADVERLTMLARRAYAQKAYCK